MESYTTEILDETITNIFAFSDVHADIYSLIISLRDCAKVIRKKNSSDEYNLESLLNLNLNIPEERSKYVEDLGYEWIGLNTNIVIIGDILDGNRGQKNKNVKKIIYDKISGEISGEIIDDQSKKTKKKKEVEFNAPDHEYLQIEIKILLFINNMNKQAMTNHGRIHKVFGNHEITNILFTEIEQDLIAQNKSSDIIGYKNQIFESAIENGNYYNGYTRYQIFNPKNEGYNLLLEDGCGILLKINNNIFVHGSLTPIPLTVITRINNQINNPITPISELIEIFKNFGGSYTIKKATKTDYIDTNMLLLNNLVYARHYGLPFNENIKFKKDGNVFDSDHFKDNQTYRSDNKKKTFIFDYIKNDKAIATCEKVTEDLKIFMGTTDTNIINNLRVIVGHCIQQDSANDYKIIKGSDEYVVEVTATTYSEIRNSDDVSEILVKHSTGKQDISVNRIFGITMECHKSDDLFQVYRVDIGSSRSQDYYTDMKKKKENTNDRKYLNNITNLVDEKNILFSRTPQVLHIVKSTINDADKIFIIRSKMKNTRINQPRSIYEKSINSIGHTHGLDNSELNMKDQYYLKYIKYKNKYLNLKK